MSAATQIESLLNNDNKDSRYGSILSRIYSEWQTRCPGFSETILVKELTVNTTGIPEAVALIFFRKKGSSYHGVLLYQPCQPINTRQFYLEYADNLRLTDKDNPFIGDHQIECKQSNLSRKIFDLLLK